MSATFITLLFTLICWGIFFYSFNKDRSRYRNCYLLALALFSLFPFVMQISGSHMAMVLLITFLITMLFLLIVPFFLIYNGIIMIKREGRCLAHMLSLGLGIAVLIGEVLAIINASSYILYFSAVELESVQAYITSDSFLIRALIITTVMYGSMSFVIFMIYSIFLMIVPKKKDFDYVIIHGAGLLEGERLTKLLQERVDKAIDVYRGDSSPTKLIPSGGKGSDENISEAEAMKRYLLEKGIPEDDIILEDRSATTLENLKFSKDIIDSRDGRKYTALVTSNYHVYRALRYCRQVGLECTGIGSRVAFYFWPSALIREYIAVHAEKKHALIFGLGWIFWLLVTVILIKAN